MNAQIAPRREPVPAASQLAVLPFLAALEGYLRNGSPVSDCRLTIHRVMVRGNKQYLQQVANYRGYADGGAGRVFATTEGIMGAAYRQKVLFRTRRFENENAYEIALRLSLEHNHETSDPALLPKSYVAIPIAGSDNRIIMVLYGDSKTFNRFADDLTIQNLVAMSRGYCRLIDDLQTTPLGPVRNYPLMTADDFLENPTVYKELQEPVSKFEIPKLATVSSFNFEAAAD